MKQNKLNKISGKIALMWLAVIAALLVGFIDTAGADSPVTASELSISKKILSTQKASPVATVKAAAGTAATCALTHASDLTGIITLTTTSTSSATGAQCDITFDQPYFNVPLCFLQPANTNAQLKAVVNDVYLSSTAAKFSINFGVAEATGLAYVYNYICLAPKD